MFRYLIYFISGSFLIAIITTIAETKSAKLAGIAMSLPGITFLSLIFIGISQGSNFSSKAAMWNPIGCVADLAFMGLFAIGINLLKYVKFKNVGRNTNIKENENLYEVLCGISIALLGYFLIILVLSKIPTINGWTSVAFLWIAVVFFCILFKNYVSINTKNIKKIVSKKDIILRGLFGGCTVAAVVIVGDIAGDKWAGLFSSFPGTIAPVLILLHYRNGKNMSYNVIKSAPIGLASTGLYSLIVWLSYPIYGIWIGTFVSYLVALVFLIILINFCNYSATL